MNKSKTQLYRKTEWYAFRDAVIENDGCKCVRCGRTQDETVLQVHHLRYVPGAKPWEYGMKDCETLCKRCHAEEHGEVMPTSGWELVGVNDLGDLIGECEKCGSSLRYEYEIVHEKWGAMTVGTICCDYLTGSLEASSWDNKRKRTEARKRTFLKSSRWKVNNGAYSIRHGVFDAVIRPEKGGYRLFIDNKKGNIYESLTDAKRKLFDVVENGELVAWYKKKGMELPTGKRKTK